MFSGLSHMFKDVFGNACFARLANRCPWHFDCENLVVHYHCRFETILICASRRNLTSWISQTPALRLLHHCGDLVGLRLERRQRGMSGRHVPTLLPSSQTKSPSGCPNVKCVPQPQQNVPL